MHQKQFQHKHHGTAGDGHLKQTGSEPCGGNAHYQRGGLGDVKVKKFLNSVMQAELEPIRTRRKEWEQRLPEVVEILKEGSAYAEKTAAATLADVRRSMRIDYFDNDNLLK